MARGLLIGLVLLLAVLLTRTLLVDSHQIDVVPVEPIALDRDGLSERLSAAIRLRTISYGNRERIDTAPFLDFHGYLQQSFPVLHERLDREVVGGYSLLYTWRGSAPELAPVLLMGHIDVVPVAPWTESQWTHPPFSGAVADGFVWGRGALDMKQTVVGFMEAVEWLIESGFEPRRTVHLALHHDEEIGGEHGAAAIAALLDERGIRLWLTLDEGSVITDGIVPGVERPAALVAISDKGYLTVELTASGDSGHSSMPPSGGAVARLARALDRLETNQMPAELRFPASGIFEQLASEMPFLMRMIMANRWLFEPLLLSKLESSPVTNATVRTTTAATMLRASGVKENVLASEARAVVNFRLLPGDTVDDVLAHVRRTVDDDRVKVEIVGTPREASPVSSIDSPAYEALHRSIKQVFPEVAVAPSLVVGGTDSKHYAKVAESSFRFLPVTLASPDLKRIHGTNERIAIDAYLDSIRFYVQLLRNAAGPPG